MLTDAMIKRLPASAKGYKRHDRDGLYIWIAPTGRKFFRSKYVRDGKERAPISLGEYPGTSLKDAREQNAEVRAQLRRGVDVATERRHAKLVRTTQAEQSLELLAREWHARQLSSWGDRHADDVIHSLEKDVFPIIGKLPVTAITPARVWSALEPVETRGAIETAHRIRQRLSEVFAYAIARGLVETNPADGIKAALKPVQRGHLPAIVDLETLRTMLRSAEAQAGAPGYKIGRPPPGAVRCPSRRPLRCAVGGIHGARQRQTAMADPRRAHEDGRGACRAAAARSGAGDRGGAAIERIAVPISSPTRATLTSQWARTRSAITLIAMVEPGRHVPHGFRSSFSSIMTERHPHDHEVIETVLAHAIGGTRGVYMRADFNGRRRMLHAEWAGLLLQGLM